MKYATIKKMDIANGPGVRVSIFVSGCRHHCKGCFNQEAWDFNYGTEFTEDTINEILEALKPNYITGLSLLGGEPFEKENQAALVELTNRVKEVYPDKTIWAYSGFLFDKQIRDKMCTMWEETPKLLKNVDILVDGKFEEENKDPKLFFRGSSNQRIIDVQESLAQNEVVLKDEIYLKEQNRSVFSRQV
ncbi:MAG: anaerobic ribonucleoside-triphosphate reductase activating protein [Clostridia bacterium]|nr:anaerobic ribonucleoside-triphosphate reductase activating protein [Clostridia bacterium]MBR6641358.1 anaerobic ribonucleoside-triphosphate reductase activating protein [Clostridia bacterium]